MTGSRGTGSPQFLRLAAIAFGIGFSLHALDHARRGFSSAPTRVFVLGTIQGLCAVAAVWMALRGRKGAPVAAIAVGFGSALLFTNGHLLPISPDSYVSAPDHTVTWFSWVTAFGEIVTATLFGIAGLIARFGSEDSRDMRTAA